MRSETEECLIEPSINSVRLSLRIKQADELEKLLCSKFSKFMMQRAVAFMILRRVPVPGYDLTFLITFSHTVQLRTDELIDFIAQFMEEVDREISEMKIDVNARSRAIAHSFLKEFS